MRFASRCVVALLRNAHSSDENARASAGADVAEQSRYEGWRTLPRGCHAHARMIVPFPSQRWLS